MKKKNKHQQPQQRPRRKAGAICNDYLKPCTMASKCSNCKNRGFRVNRRTGEKEIYCKANGDINGDHFKCFVCGEGAKCDKDA